MTNYGSRLSTTKLLHNVHTLYITYMYVYCWATPATAIAALVRKYVYRLQSLLSINIVIAQFHKAIVEVILYTSIKGPPVIIRQPLQSYHSVVLKNQRFSNGTRYKYLASSHRMELCSSSYYIYVPVVCEICSLTS